MQKFFTFLLLIGVFAICFLVSEVFIRNFIPFKTHTDERNLTYNHDPELGWFPKKNSVKKFEGSKIIDVAHNDMGFRDINHKPNHKPNIIFLGDSFVWGYDVQVENRFTEILREKFQNKFNIVNFGVSGYGTDQEFLLLNRYYDKFKPKAVFLIFCTNDFYNNSNNIVYHGYHKPYFVSKDGELELRGVPVPISINYKILEFDKNYPILSKSHIVKWFARLYGRAKYNFQKDHDLEDPTYKIFVQINKFLEEKGSKLIVGAIDTDPKMEEFFARNNISYINLDTKHRFTSHGNHWDLDGHKFAAQKIAVAIEEF